MNMLSQLYTNLVDWVGNLNEPIFFTIIALIFILALLCMVSFLKANKLEDASGVKKVSSIVGFIIFLGILVLFISLR